MSKPTETWLPVKGYESTYEVSSTGNVRRCKGFGNPKAARHRKLVPRGKYFQVILSKGGKVELQWAHRIVAFAFLGNPSPGTDRVNHKDGNGRNNAVENLEWVNHSGNCQHAYDTGLRVAAPSIGEQQTNAKLTDDSVRLIRESYGARSLSQLANQFGVDKGTIHKVVTRQSWKHVA